MTTYKEYRGSSRVMKADSEWLGAEDLPIGQDVPAHIESVAAFDGKVAGKRKQGYCLKFAGKTKRLIINQTIRRTLNKLFTDDTAAWFDKPVLLYVDERVRDPETGGVCCGVRIRDKVPPPKKQAAAPTLEQLVDIACDTMGESAQQSDGQAAVDAWLEREGHTHITTDVLDGARALAAGDWLDLLTSK